MTKKIVKTDEEWQDILTPDQYRVCRKQGTETPFSGEFADYKGAGIFVCACCGNALFDARSKFDSGTGWPSFFEAISQDAVLERSDTSLGMTRTEVVCAACDAHLGHVFPDGPPPTGRRYCINSVCLRLEKSP